MRFEGEGVPEVLRVAKREVKQRMKVGMVDAAESAVLPEVRDLTPTIVKEAVTVKGAVKGPKITTQGPRKLDNILGLLNFGGNVVSPIKPVQGEGHQALSVAPGVVRARVETPRHYKGKGFIERGIELGLPNFKAAVMEAVMQSFNGIPHEP